VAKVTNYYGISGPVPFEDIDVSTDNGLYLDPRAVRLRGGPSPFVADAIHCADSFLNEVAGCIMSGDRASFRRGEGLLQCFPEPWETRLGMSAKGFQGHGGSTEVGSWIWEALTTDLRAFVVVGVLHQLEDLPMFVGGVDKDMTSDLTTRIMFSPIARFTESMVARYPEFTAGGRTLKTVTRQVWEPSVGDWGEESFTLPVADDKPLMLVPKGWARKNLLMSSTRFYDKAVLDYAQQEQAVMLPSGKILMTPKDALRKQADLRPGRGTVLRVTKRALDSNRDLIAIFKEFVDSKVSFDD
jgi:hypothetical protein